MPKTTTRWSSKLVFIFAAAGAAVGLGNIWRFPYVTGENGGGIFVVCYLLAVITLGLPLMISEIVIGRHGRQNPEKSVLICAQEANVHPAWRWVGTLTVISAFLVLSFYTIISGWVLHYLFISLIKGFEGITPNEAAQQFTHLSSHFSIQVFWTTLVVAGSILVIALGIHRGIEKVVYVMFPTLLLLMLILLCYGIYSSGFTDSLNFLFTLDFSRFTVQTILIAIGQAFFSLGIALAVLMMYGAYLSNHHSIIQTSIGVSVTDTSIALFAGIAIFPIVFSQHIEPDQGPSLIFRSLPLAFGHMPLGHFFAALFFLMLEFAAFTSVIGFLEPTSIWLKEHTRLSRPLSAVMMGILVWLANLLNIASLSLNALKSWQFDGLSFFEWSEALSSKFTLPLGGLLIALFCGWRMPVTILKTELNTTHRWLFWSWLWSLRVIAPIGIGFVFLASLMS